MKRIGLFSSLLAGAGVALAVATPAFAITYNVNVYEKSLNQSFNATLGSVGLFSGGDTSTASFTYNGPLNFSNTNVQNSNNQGDLTSGFFGANAAGIAGYSGTGPSTVAYGFSGANFLTLASFLNTSGSVNGYVYGSLYTFTAAPGSYGGAVLTLTHDDGVSVYANGALLPGTTAGPTSAITESVVLPTGTTSYQIVYGRENGSPSVLTVAVPEPVSLALLGGGLAGLGLLRRRDRPAKLPA